MVSLECLFFVLDSITYIYASRIVSNESSLLLKGGAYSAGVLIALLLPGAVIRHWVVIRSFTVCLSDIAS